MSLIFIALTALMALVMYFDITRYLIPNWLVGMVLACYPAAALLSPLSIDWLHGVLVMLCVFAAGYAVFAMRWMGGGDIKLLTACALWAGMDRILDFLVITALGGGALAVLALAARKAVARLDPARASSPRLPRILKDREPIPYGLAIALAFLWLLWAQKLPGIYINALI